MITSGVEWLPVAAMEKHQHDARDLYQLTTILNRSYYTSSTQVSRMKHVSSGMEFNVPRGG